jgi:3-isopropylmalate/(R)-2-methylmalate dehydratase small subunit
MPAGCWRSSIATDKMSAGILPAFMSAGLRPAHTESPRYQLSVDILIETSTMGKILKGVAIKVGDNIDTDGIIPAKYCHSYSEKELSKHVMEGVDSGFQQRIKREGSILIAGSNFGCGSAREHAPLAIKGSVISAVIAVTFSRTFFRNAINIGLPVFELSEADQINEGDSIEINTDSCAVTNVSTGKIFQAVPFPESVKQIIDAGGLIEYAKRRLAEKNKIDQS